MITNLQLYNDPAAIIQVIGGVFNNPTLLDEADKYCIIEEDFQEEFHRIVFGSILNIYSDTGSVNLDTIVDYLANRPKYNAIFKLNKGIEYIEQASRVSKPETFNYYYNRMKKFTLLRTYTRYGIDVSWIYDPSIVLDTKRKQEQEDMLDAMSLSSIADKVEHRIEEIRSKCVEDNEAAGCQAGEGIDELLASLEEHPDVGIPLFGDLINTITRGGRLGKFYLRSAPTNLCKTRSMVANAWTFAATEIYDGTHWVKKGVSEPTSFILTEQDKSEFQQMSLAFIADVNEEHIAMNSYLPGERERVRKAAEIIKNSPLWIEYLPDFSVQEIENAIRKHIREHGVKFVVFDYIQTSMKILEEVTRRSGGVKMREDNILFMLATNLKSIAQKNDIFLLSATQLNMDYQTSSTPDQNLLRGAKSIGDKIDFGSIFLPVTDEDLQKIAPILKAHPEFEQPKIKESVYKNRGNQYKGIYLWCSTDLGTCKIKPMFATTWRHELINIENTNIVMDTPGAWKE